MTALFWHRRDLRLSDNRGLHVAATENTAVLAVFIFDPAILARPDTAISRVDYMLRALAELQTHYAQRGGRLVIRTGDPVQILPELATELSATAVYWNEDVEPYARQRDQAVTAALHSQGITGQCYQDMLLHGPGEVVTKSDGNFYSVYGPFWKNWAVQRKLAPFPIPAQFNAPACASDPLPSLADWGLSLEQTPWPAGEQVAHETLAAFLDSSRIWDYDEARNFPAIDGTSSLSPHLRWGTIGIRTIWQATIERQADCRSEEAETSLRTWRQELAWREFYKHCLYRWPELETTAFRSQFDDFEWSQNTEHFEAWCAGQTGYPIVDAAMRQLNETGWMHNRCRMIVASFLTKDLLLDWRWGERYFMQKLVDGDLAANNGGWQWSASVGTDPKPLRIFNPSTQASRYDAEADYIRRYLPELRRLHAQELIDPSRLTPLERRSYDYPAPLVDHKRQQVIFKQRYAACKAQ